MSAERLWDKGLPLDELVHRFTVGEDPVTDLVLVEHDAVASAAHVRGLSRVGLLSQSDCAALLPELQRIAVDGRAGRFVIRPEQEDVHTAIEAQLTERLGEAGGRVHLGRSRNDQVQVALRLYMRQAVGELGEATATLAQGFLDLARRGEPLPLPGYTHLQRAMPSSFGMWAASFAEGLLEELEALQGVDRRLDRCPLGGAAGFGAPLPLDRPYVARLLGFSRVQISPIEVQNSRGRHEQALVGWVASVAGVLERFLWDLVLFCSQEFGFVRLPPAFTTGSSIMPQKRNPDVAELARGRCRELRGLRATVEHLASGLPSSYHRDLQLLKRPLVESLGRGAELLAVLGHLLPALELQPERAAAACSDDLYAAAEACRLVLEQGQPFRQAYRVVAEQIGAGSFAPQRAALPASHLGGLGQLGLGELATELERQRAWLAQREERLRGAWGAVWDLGCEPRAE